MIVRGSGVESDDPTLVRSPELFVGRAWKRQLPKGPAGETLRSLIEQASGLLEEHPVNRVRIDLGENPANLIWLWGSADARSARTFAERTNRSGVVISNWFPMRGFARTVGVDWKEGPTSFEEGPLQRQRKVLGEAIKRYDVVYLHLRIDAADPVERLCAMERIDQILLKPMTEALPAFESWRLLAAIDDRKHGSIPFVAIGSGLPQQPVARLDARSLADSPLTFADGPALFSWFTTIG